MSESFEEIKCLVDRIKKDHQQKLYEMCKKECGNSGFLNLQQLDMIFGVNSESNSSANAYTNVNDSSNKESKKEENNMFSLTHEALLKSTGSAMTTVVIPCSFRFWNSRWQAPFCGSYGMIFALSPCFTSACL